MTDPTQKLALITGAARGIGLATTNLFLAEGWQVAMLTAFSLTIAPALVDTALDLSKTSQTEKTAKQLDKLFAGTCTGLILI